MSHFEKLYTNYPRLQPCQQAIQAAVAMLATCILRGGKILIAGNGGSAADAEHIVGELMKGFHLKRPLSNSQRLAFQQTFPDCADFLIANLQQAIPAISLVGSIALATAFANDVNPEFIFAQQIFGLGKPGDIFLGISTSGNSANILQALKVAKALGLNTLGLTGESGGQMAQLCDVVIRVPSSRVVDIQEMHLPVYHALCAELEEQFFGAGKPCADFEVQTKGDAFPPKNIELIVFDFDGVFTDNKVFTLQDGTESVACDRRDGLGIDILKKCAYPHFILSTETNPVVQARARKLGIEVFQACGDKAQFLQQYFSKHHITPENVVYVGNDINDLEAMKLIGWPIAPRDSHPEILKIAALVLKTDGGHGAVRELCELLLPTGDIS